MNGELPDFSQIVFESKGLFFNRMHGMKTERPESASSSGYCRSEDSNRSRSPVSQWLALLRDSTEVESLSALQAKSVAVDEESFEALSVRNAQVALRKTRKDFSDIRVIIDHLINQLPLTIEDLYHFKLDVEDISCKIHALIEHCRRRGCDSITGMKGRKMSTDIAVYGLQISKFVDDFNMKHNVNNAQLEASLRKMKERVTQVVDSTTEKDLCIIINALRFPWGSICSKWSILALWQLTQNDNQVSHMLVNHGVIKRLMKLSCLGCGSTTPSPNINPQLKASALRVLTHLCSNHEATRQIFACEQEIGSSLITLISLERNELILKEAVGLILKMTLPLIDSKKSLGNTPSNIDFLIKLMPMQSLVKSLSNLGEFLNFPS